MDDHLATRMDDGALGYILLLRDGGGTRADICIEWAPRGHAGIDKVKARVRKSRPRIETLYFFCGTVTDLVELRRGLCRSWTGVGPWFEQTGPMKELLEQLHQQDREEIARLEEEEHAYLVQLVEKSVRANAVAVARQRNMKTKRKSMST